MSRSLRPSCRAVLVVLLATVSASCGAGGDRSQEQPPVATSTSEATSDATTVTVIETEFSITVADTSLTPGRYAFAVENAGTADHDLVIEGPGTDTLRTAVIDSGGTGELVTNLQPGTYELWCSVGNHRERGMTASITVE